DRTEERDHRAVVLASRLLEQPLSKPQKSDASDPFWGLAHSVRRVSLEKVRRTRIATPLFHLRGRLAWHGLAPPALGHRLRAGCARGLVAVGRSSAKHHN